MFTLHQYINQNESPWDKFVLSSNNGTLFHLRKFLNYHPKDRFQDHSILIEKKQNLFSVLPAAELIVDSKRILVSHPGSTVGSFVVPENLSIADAMSMSEALVTYVKENNFSSWINRFKELNEIEYNKVIKNDLFPKKEELTMGEAIESINKHSNGDAVIVTDAGQHQMVACRYAKFNYSQSNLTSGGLGTMGIF